MVQSNQAVWGMMEEEMRSYKGPPSLAHHRALELRGRGKDFFGGYCYMSQGPLPQMWAKTLMSARGLWGRRWSARWSDYNHVVGLKIVGEMLPQETQPRHAGGRDGPIRTADSAHHLFLVRQRPAPDRSFARFMTQALEAVDATEHLASE